MIQQITAYRFEQLNRQTEQLSNLLIFKFLNLKTQQNNESTHTFSQSRPSIFYKCIEMY